MEFSNDFFMFPENLLLQVTHDFPLGFSSFLCLEYVKKLTLCGFSANCNTEEGQEIIEKSNCLSVIARDFERIWSVKRENQRIRDRVF